MSGLDRFGRQPARQSGEVSRHTERHILAIQEQTKIEIAKAMSTLIVGVVQDQNIDRLAMAAAIGQSGLRDCIHALAAGDPIKADELDMFANQARIGKFQVNQGVIDAYVRQAFNV